MTGAREDVKADSVVDHVMRTWPSTIRVFLDFHMGCVGCAIGPFHTVRDACHEHGVDLETFLTALRKARPAA